MNKINKITQITDLSKNTNKTEKNSSDFSSVLNDTLKEINDLQKKGEKAVSDIATGSVKDLHQAAMAINKAELSMKLMLEVRNKALNAYKELSRIQM